MVRGCDELTTIRRGGFRGQRWRSQEECRRGKRRQGAGSAGAGQRGHGAAGGRQPARCWMQAQEGQVVGFLVYPAGKRGMGLGRLAAIRGRVPRVQGSGYRVG